MFDSFSKQQAGRIQGREKMDLRASSLLVIAILVLDISRVAHGNLSFQVHHKFGGRGKSLSELKAHDHKRHGRLLSVIDLNLGGNGLPTEAGYVSCCFFYRFIYQSLNNLDLILFPISLPLSTTND